MAYEQAVAERHHYQRRGKMGGLLLFVLVAFVLLGVWRILVAARSAHGDGQFISHVGTGIPFFVAAALVLIF
jgi:hypothetical protein